MLGLLSVEVEFQYFNFLLTLMPMKVNRTLYIFASLCAGAHPFLLHHPIILMYVGYVPDQRTSSVLKRGNAVLQNILHKMPKI